MHHYIVDKDSVVATNFPAVCDWAESVIFGHRDNETGQYFCEFCGDDVTDLIQEWRRLNRYDEPEPHEVVTESMINDWNIHNDHAEDYLDECSPQCEEIHAYLPEPEEFEGWASSEPYFREHGGSGGGE